MTMDKYVFKKADPNALRTVIYPCTIRRAGNGGTVTELSIDVEFALIDPDVMAKATMPFSLNATGKDGDVVVYDLAVKGFPGLPGAEGVPPADVIASVRSDPEAVKGIAAGYFRMIAGRVPGN
jgi:hypothetical protein